MFKETYCFVKIALHEAQRECTLANTTGAQNHRAKFANMLVVVMLMLMISSHCIAKVLEIGIGQRQAEVILSVGAGR